MKPFSLITYAFWTIATTQSVQAQNWLPMDKGIDCFYNGNVKRILVDSINDKLYISGTFNDEGNCNPLRGVASWTGQNWIPVGNPTEGNASKNAICMYNDSLYLYGIFFNSTSTQYLAKWDGLNWDTVPQSPNNTVSCFLEKDNHLYIGGGLDHLGNDSTFLLGKYDGISFSALTPYYGSQSGNIITCMAFYQDTLYVGGNFHMMPYKNLSDFAKFDGTDLALVSSDFANLGSSCSIESMVTYKNELYLGGYFKKTDGYAGNYIMKWDGSGFTEVGNGLNERVTCMQVYNNELYVGGSFTQAGSVNSNYIAKWDGTNWHSLTTDTFTGSYPMILSLNFYRDSLIIGGTFTEINGNPHMQRIAKYSQPIMNVKIKSKPDDVFCVYPNPAASTMTIELKSLHTNTSAQIKNSLGQLIQSFTLNGSDNKILVDVNEYPPGVYFILLQNEGKTLVKKFIKK